VARALGADQIAQTLPLYVAATKDDTPRLAPVEIYSAPLVPTDSWGEILLDQLLGSEVSSFQQQRARQAEQVRSIAEDFTVD